MKKLLLIVDPQIDFITGTLPVAGAAEAMDALAKYVKEKGNEYNVKIVTADWHPYHHSSFADEGGMLLLMNQRVASPYCIRAIA